MLELPREKGRKEGRKDAESQGCKDRKKERKRQKEKEETTLVLTAGDLPAVAPGPSGKVKFEVYYCSYC